MLQSPSNPLKTRIETYNPKKLRLTKSDGWFDSPEVTSLSKCIEICINNLWICKHQQKNR